MRAGRRNGRSLAVRWRLLGSHRPVIVNGTATIIDADTIVIGSERIRFQGVDAPETDQICLDRRGAVWKCEIDARDRLIRYIGARETSCVTNGKKDVFRSVACDLLHERGGPRGRFGLLRGGPRRGFHPILQSVRR